MFVLLLLLLVVTELVQSVEENRCFAHEVDEVRNRDSVSALAGVASFFTCCAFGFAFLDSIHPGNQVLADVFVDHGHSAEFAGLQGLCSPAFDAAPCRVHDVEWVLVAGVGVLQWVFWGDYH